MSPLLYFMLNWFEFIGLGMYWFGIFFLIFFFCFCFCFVFWALIVSEQALNNCLHRHNYPAGKKNSLQDLVAAVMHLCEKTLSRWRRSPSALGLIWWELGSTYRWTFWLQEMRYSISTDTRAGCQIFWRFEVLKWRAGLFKGWQRKSACSKPVH